MVATDDRHDSRCRESDGERQICTEICGVTCCTMIEETEATRTAGWFSRRDAPMLSSRDHDDYGHEKHRGWEPTACREKHVDERESRCASEGKKRVPPRGDY